MRVRSGTTVLVTGATGLLGNNVTRMLRDRDARVRVLVREGFDPRVFAGLEVECFRGDLRDPEAVTAACADRDLVIHAAAVVRIGRRDLPHFEEINVAGTRHVLEAARQSGSRLVHVSTADTVGVKSLETPADENTPFDPSITIPYMITKRQAETLVIEAVAAGLDAVVVNPGFLLGPWDWKPSSGAMLLAVGRGKGWFAPRGHTSFVDVRDVAQTILAAAERGTSGRTYLLTGETHSYLDAWRLFAEVTNRRPPVSRLSRVGSQLAGRTGDLCGWILGKELPVNSGALGISDLPRNYSSRRAEQELGFQRRPLKTTVEDAWNWFREHGYA